MVHHNPTEDFVLKFKTKSQRQKVRDHTKEVDGTLLNELLILVHSLF